MIRIRRVQLKKLKMIGITQKNTEMLYFYRGS